MNIPIWLRRFRYSPAVIHLVARLHLSDFTRNLFNTLTLPNRRILRVRVSGINAKFVTESKTQLEYISQSLLCGRHRELGLLEKILARLDEGDVFYDIGSNVGLFAVFAAKRVGPRGCVVSFEPASSNFKFLQRNILLNGLENVIPLPVALGKRSRKASLYLDDEKSSLVLNVSPNKTTQRVAVMSGDEVVRLKSLPKPKVIKIDVEGYEVYVIQGLKKILADPICRMVCCEIHPGWLPHGQTADDIEILMSSLGFTRIETADRVNTWHAIYARE